MRKAADTNRANTRTVATYSLTCMRELPYGEYVLELCFGERRAWRGMFSRGMGHKKARDSRRLSKAGCSFIKQATSSEPTLISILITSNSNNAFLPRPRNHHPRCCKLVRFHSPTSKPSYLHTSIKYLTEDLPQDHGRSQLQVPGPFRHRPAMERAHPASLQRAGS